MSKQYKSVFGFLFVCLIINALPLANLHADTIHVGGANGDYETITEGVAAAHDGDTILIAPGTFNVPDTIVLNNKSIRLIGSGPWKTFITWSGPTNGNIFEIIGPNTIETSIESLMFHLVQGRCLLIEESSVHVDSCWFVDNSHTADHIFEPHGSAISAHTSNLAVESSVFLRCRTNMPHGGAIYLQAGIDDPNFSSIRNSYFIDNEADASIRGNPGSTFNAMGGAVYVSANVEIQRCSFSQNVSPGQGGAIALGPHRNASIQECEFMNNLADEGGALYFSESPREVAVVSGNHFENCVATQGGAIANRSSHSIQLGNVWIVGNDFLANQASSRGGGLAMTGAPVLAYNQLLDNFSGWKGGGLSLNHPLDIYSSRESALVIACQFTGNESQIGGAMIAETFGSLQKPLTDHIRVEYCQFNANWASTSGGVLAAEENSSLFFRGCQFANNASPSGDVFFNPDGNLLSAAGCNFGLNGSNDLGSRWLNGPGNQFANWTSPTRLAWSGGRGWVSGDRITTYWPPADLQGDPYQVLTGIPYEMDALAFLPDGDILFSLKKPESIEGLLDGPDGDRVDDSDIIRFHPAGYGRSFSGSMQLYVDGSDVGLTSAGENIDALAVDEQGRLYISIAGSGSLPNVGAVKNRSILRLTPTQLGPETTGNWEQLVDGRDIGLNLASENIDGLDIAPTADGAEISFLISTKGKFQVPEFQEEFSEPQILRFDAFRLGPNSATEGQWSIFPWDGTGNIFSTNPVDYFSLID